MKSTVNHDKFDGDSHVTSRQLTMLPARSFLGGFRGIGKVALSEHSQGVSWGIPWVWQGCCFGKIDHSQSEVSWGILGTKLPKAMQESRKNKIAFGNLCGNLCGFEAREFA